MAPLGHIFHRFLSLTVSTAETDRTPRSDAHQPGVQDDWRLEEALMASMYDEGARMYLDHYSAPRRGRHFG